MCRAERRGPATLVTPSPSAVFARSWKELQPKPGVPAVERAGEVAVQSVDGAGRSAILGCGRLRVWGCFAAARGANVTTNGDGGHGRPDTATSRGLEIPIPGLRPPFGPGHVRLARLSRGLPPACSAPNRSPSEHNRGWPRKASPRCWATRPAQPILRQARGRLLTTPGRWPDAGLTTTALCWRPRSSVASSGITQAKKAPSAGQQPAGRRSPPFRDTDAHISIRKLSIPLPGWLSSCTFGSTRTCSGTDPVLGRWRRVRPGKPGGPSAGSRESGARGFLQGRCPSRRRCPRIRSLELRLA